MQQCGFIKCQSKLAARGMLRNLDSDDISLDKCIAFRLMRLKRIRFLEGFGKLTKVKQGRVRVKEGSGPSENL